MRVSLKKALLIILSIGIVLIVLMWNNSLHSVPPTAIMKSEHPCFHDPYFTAELHNFAYRVHRILFKLGLTHYLCYGSLWGQIRVGGALPWQSDVEICLKNEEIDKDETFITKMFRSNSLHIEYSSADGLYTVTDINSPEMKVELIVFEIDKMIDVSRRIGWKRRLLPPDCTMVPSLHCFPPSLVETPLPMKKFGEYMLPVPRDGIEIQKYLYPDNWWKEIVPSNCNLK